MKLTLARSSVLIINNLNCELFAFSSHPLSQKNKKKKEVTRFSRFSSVMYTYQRHEWRSLYGVFLAEYSPLVRVISVGKRQEIRDYSHTDGAKVDRYPAKLPTANCVRLACIVRQHSFYDWQFYQPLASPYYSKSRCIGDFARARNIKELPARGCEFARETHLQSLYFPIAVSIHLKYALCAALGRHSTWGF